VAKKKKPTNIIWTTDEIAKTDFLVFRESSTEKITNVIAPNGLQIGLFDKEFVANLNVTGTITGSGEIYTLSSVTAKTGFTGSLQKTIGGTDFLQAGSNVTVTNNEDGSITIASSAGALNNLTTGDGLQLDSGSTYNGASARTISLDLKSSSGLKIDSAELAIEPSDFAGAGLADDGSDNLKVDIANQTNVTAATGDYVLIADADDSYNLKRTTVASIQSVSSFDIAALGSSLTESTLASGDLLAVADIDDSNTVKKITAEDLGQYLASGTNAGIGESSGKLTIDLNDLSVAAIAVADDSFAFIDASDNTTKKESIVDLVTAIRGTTTTTGLASTSGVLNIDITNQSTLALAAADELLVWDVDASVIRKTTISDVQSANLSLDSLSAATIAVADDSFAFIDADDSNNSKKESIADFVSLMAGDGLAATSGVLSLDLSELTEASVSVSSDYIPIIDGGSSGTSRKESIADLVSAVASTGISAVSGQLSVDFGSSAGQVALGSNTITIVAGDGISGGGSAALGGNVSLSVDINPEDFAGKGIIASSDDLHAYIQGGSNVTITTGSENQFIIAASDTDTTYSAGTGINLSSTEFSIDDSVVATLSGSTFSGPVVFSDSVKASNLSGSLTNLTDGSSYLIAGSNVTITTGSSGAVTISSTGAGGSGDGDSSAQYLVLSATGSLSSERVFTAGTGISTTDAGAGGSLTVLIDDSVVATLSGSTFTGIVKAPYMSGSLTNLTDGSSYLIAGSNVTITTGSSGAVTIAASGGSSLTAAQDGGSSYASTSTLNFSGSTVVDNGGGQVTITPVIGAAEDGSYLDGLFTDFTYTTLIGTAIDKFNEVLKALAPTPAPQLDDVDCNTSDGTTAYLSFGSSNDQSAETPAYYSVSTAAGFSAVDVNGSYAAATSGNNIKKGIYDGTQTITGDLNEDVSQNLNGSEVNFVANSFGNAEVGTLKLEINGVVVHSFELTGSSIGSGIPGSGAASQLNGNSSGFTNFSQTGSAVLSNGDSFPSFQHRTGRYQVGTADQRKGWNYARVIHSINSSDTTTNYVEWVNDPDANALAATGNSISAIGLSGSIFISGVEYNTSASATYKVKVDNAYKYVYDTTNITFTTTNGSIAAQSKPTIGGSEDHTKALHVTGTLETSTDEMLDASVTAAVNVSHPMKSNLSSGGSSSASGFLIFNVTDSSTDLQETFTMEGKRLVSSSYSAMVDISGGSNDWNSVLHLSGAASQTDGLIYYNHRLYSAINTLESGDFRNSAQGGSLANSSDNNPDYSGLTSGTKTFFRAFKNTTGSSVKDLDLTIVGSGTTIVNLATGLNSGRCRILTKIPGKTDWMDLATAFSYQTSSYGSGASHVFDSSISSTSTNIVTFGTGTIANNEYVVFAIESDAAWSGYIDTMTVNFPAAGTINAAPTLDDIDCNDTGVSGNLSFGSSKSISGYADHSTTGGFSAVDINGEYSAGSSSNNLKQAIFDGTTVIDGELNEDVGSTTYYSANAFKDAHSGSLKLEVNGSTIHTLDLYDFAFSGNSLNGNSSGFTGVSVPAKAVDSSGVPDYTKWYRTASYKVGTADQRDGWNYARVIHTYSGIDNETNYVEWVNDSDSNALSTSNAVFGSFGSSVTYYQSGVKYYVSPTGSLAFTVDNCYKNIYSNSNSAVSMGSLTNFTVSNVAIQGLGISNSSTAASAVTLPDLDVSVTDPQTLPIHVTASLVFSQASSLPSSSIAGGTQYNGSLGSTILHPLKSSGALSSQTKSNFLVYTSSNGSNLNTDEYFAQEVYRIRSGSYTSQVSTTATPWDSSISMNDNGGYPSYATGLLIYNDKLISPKKGPVSGDFRDYSESGDLTAPIGNPDYSTLTNAVRHYKRYFKNNTSTDTPQITITIRGNATIVGRAGASAGTLGTNLNCFIDVKIPGKTGWMDTARASAGSGNILDGDGALSGGLDATIDVGGATNICTFNGETCDGTASSAEYVIVSVVASENWTGYISRITIAYS